MSDAVKFRLIINHAQPLDASDFAQSIQSLTDLHETFSVSAPDKKPKLFIKKINEGSIIISFLDFAQQIPLAGIEDFNDFIIHLREIYKAIKLFKPLPDYIKKILKKNVKKNCSCIKKIANPARKQGNHINIENGEESISITPEDIKNIDERMNEEIEELENFEEITKIKKHQNFYWQQATGNENTSKNDKGIIEGIFELPLPVIFEKPVKEKILSEALFRKIYVVDVEVDYMNEKPIRYRILFVHEEKPLMPKKNESDQNLLF